MTNTRRGHDAERKCAQALKALGYDVVRSAASKSIWDLIAIGNYDIKLIQCKRTKKTTRSAMAPKAVLQEMRDATSPKTGPITKELWTWVDQQQVGKPGIGWVITTVI